MMGSQVLRTKNGVDYLYYVYYDNKVRKEIYCGIASNTQSKKNLIKVEIDDLEAQKHNITKKLVELRKLK